jgi:hypothetical protein
VELEQKTKRKKAQKSSGEIPPLCDAPECSAKKKSGRSACLPQAGSE